MISIAAHKKQQCIYVVIFIFLLHLSSNTTNATIAQHDESFLFDQEVGAETDLTRKPKTPKNKDKKKAWTFIVYMAADNDLRNFASRNLKQMASIGSSDHINIVVHLDIRMSGNVKTTRRYYVEKDRIVNVGTHNDSVAMDSGDPETLISCCAWATQNFPAHEYALIFWNHGAGIIDPEHGRIVNPAELFNFNPTTARLELDRSVEYLQYVENASKFIDQRGICWDESTGNYLTNQKLEKALKEICASYLKGKRFSIIGFDACLMSMLEVASLVRPYADIMVGSQEVELGTGWNYTHVLYPFAQQSLNKSDFAAHIVAMYEKTYKSITYDYTQSAIDLDATIDVVANLHDISKLLLDASLLQTNYSVKTAVREARKKNNCTYFDEPSYIDLHHFYKNLIAQIPSISLHNSSAEAEFKKNIKEALELGMKLIQKSVIANACGANLSQAKGLSIYFPERRVHQSYTLTDFGKMNAWTNLIHQYTEPHRELIQKASQTDI